MSVTLKIAFTSRVKGQIVIENPEYIPVVGDIVDIVAEDYNQDKQMLEELALYDESGIWKVSLKMVAYSKNRTTVTIVLEEGN